MPYIYTNRASAQLAQSLDPTATNMVVQTGQGVPFPVPSGANVAQLTIVAADGTHEIVTCTSRVGDNFVIVRGQESTPAGTFPVGSRVELRLTAATLNSFLSKSGGTMTGPIDFAFHRSRNFNSEEANIRFMATEAIGSLDPVTGVGSFSHYIQMVAGGYPRIANSKLMTWSFLSQLIFIYYGGIEFLPSHLKICDGTRGTPDLRDRFVICAGPSHPQFTIGGDFNLYINPVGNHSHGGGVGGTQLEPVHLPQVNPLAKATTPVSFEAGQPGNKSVLQDANTQGLAGIGAHHGHTIGGDGGHTHTGTYHPRYYSLYYVMLEESAFN